MDVLTHAAFPVFVLCVAALAVKMIVLGHVTGALRGVKGSFVNPEDAEIFPTQGDAVVNQAEHPVVDRYLRAHRNDLESTIPFFIIGLLYLVTSPSVVVAQSLFIGFAAMRFVFTFSYVKSIQPWRSLSFIAAELVVLYMLGALVYWAV